jgi:hypothetical protein
MGIKDLVQKITGKRRANNTTCDTETKKDSNSAQPATPLGKMIMLTEKDLEGVQGGGGNDFFLKIDGIQG